MYLAQADAAAVGIEEDAVGGVVGQDGAELDQLDPPPCVHRIGEGLARRVECGVGGRVTQSCGLGFELVGSIRERGVPPGDRVRRGLQDRHCRLGIGGRRVGGQGNGQREGEEGS